MSSATLEKIIEEVRALSPDEQRTVRELLDSISESSAAFSEASSPEDLLTSDCLKRA